MTQLGWFGSLRTNGDHGQLGWLSTTSTLTPVSRETDDILETAAPEAEAAPHVVEAVESSASAESGVTDAGVDPDATTITFGELGPGT